MQPFALDLAVASLAEAESAGEIFNILIEVLTGTTPRGAIFLVRQRQLRGWSSFGYAVDAARRQGDYAAPLDSGRLGRALSGATPDPGPTPGGDPDFGQRAADESVIVPVSVTGRPIAAILAERNRDERPWDPSAIRVLCAFARLRLELTLAHRKLHAAESGATAASGAAAAAVAMGDPAHAPAGPGPGADRGGDAGSSAVDGLRPPGHGDPGPHEESVPTAGLSATGGESDPQLAAARRFARLLATDIRLYNEEAVALGRQNRDLADRLLPSIRRGKETFVERHGDLGEAGLELLREAYVSVLAAGDANLLPTSLLE